MSYLTFQRTAWEQDPAYQGCVVALSTAQSFEARARLRLGADPTDPVAQQDWLACWQALMTAQQSLYAWVTQQLQDNSQPS